MTRDTEVLRENVQHLVSEAEKSGHDMDSLSSILIEESGAIIKRQIAKECAVEAEVYNALSGQRIRRLFKLQQQSSQQST